MSRKREGLTPVLQSPIMSLKTGPRPMTWADNLMLSWWLLSVVVVVIGLELVCSALTKARAVFSLNKNRSCWNERCINVPFSRSLWVCSTKSLVFFGIFNLSVAWNCQRYILLTLQKFHFYKSYFEYKRLGFRIKFSWLLSSDHSTSLNSIPYWIQFWVQKPFGLREILQSKVVPERIKGPRNWLWA